MSLAINSAYKAYGLYQPENRESCSRVSRAEEKKDIVAFSSKAQEYKLALKSLADTPDSRVEKIDAIKAKMEAGMYEVSSNAIANKLLSGYYNDKA